MVIAIYVLIGIGVLATLTIGVAIYKQSRYYHVNGRSGPVPTWPIYAKLIGLLIAILSYGSVAVMGIYISDHTPHTVSAQIFLPVATTEAGDRVVVLGNEPALLWHCKATECDGLRPGQKVVYTTFKNKSGEQVRTDLKPS